MGTKGAFVVASFTCILSIISVYGFDNSQLTCPLDDDEKACDIQPGSGGSSSMYYYNDRRMNFRDAKAHCERSGRRLVEIRTDKKRNRLQELVKSLPRRTMVYFGANDMQREGRFVWNSDGADVTFPKSWWTRREPNNYRNEDCLAMKHSGLVNDVRCRKKLTSFCERKA